MVRLGGSSPQVSRVLGVGAVGVGVVDGVELDGEVAGVVDEVGGALGVVLAWGGW